MILTDLPTEILLLVYNSLVFCGDHADSRCHWADLPNAIHDALNFSAVTRAMRDLIAGEIWKKFQIQEAKPARRMGFWMELATENAAWFVPNTGKTEYPWRSKRLLVNVLKYVRVFTVNVNMPVFVHQSSKSPSGRLISQIQLVNPAIMPALETLNTEIGYVYSFFSELGPSLGSYSRSIELVVAFSDFVCLDKLHDYGLLPYITTFAYIYNLANKPERNYYRGNFGVISQMHNLENLFLRGFGSTTHFDGLRQIAAQIVAQIHALPKLKNVQLDGIPLSFKSDSSETPFLNLSPVGIFSHEFANSSMFIYSLFDRQCLHNSHLYDLTAPNSNTPVV